MAIRPKTLTVTSNTSGVRYSNVWVPDFRGSESDFNAQVTYVANAPAYTVQVTLDDPWSKDLSNSSDTTITWTNVSTMAAQTASKVSVIQGPVTGVRLQVAQASGAPNVKTLSMRLIQTD